MRTRACGPANSSGFSVVVAMRHGVATVPSQTVQDGPNGHYAYVIKPDDTVERRAVEVASIQDGIAVVTKGLSPGERVVVDGQYRLTNGARVKVSASANRERRAEPPSDRSNAKDLITKSIADEHFRALYPPADRDLAADAGGARLRHRRLWPLAGGGPAEGRFSDDRRIGQLSRRQPGHDGLGGRDTARAAIRGDPLARPDDLDERHRVVVDHPAIRSRTQHRRRRAGCPDRDQRRQRRPAEGPAERRRPTGRPTRRTARC